MDFIKDIYQTLFRFLRFPCKAGVFPIGSPAADAPVLITCNFDYTVRRLKKYLLEKKIDCYLVVVNTNGTNVWCAAVEGGFSTEKVLAHLKIHKVRKLVDHNRLILPQLAAAGVKRKQLQEAGWEGVFGPVYFKYIEAFLANGCKRTHEMRVIEYGYWERFKMGVSHGMFCTAVCAIPILVLAHPWWAGIALVWYFALGMQLIEQFIPVERLVYKGLVLALPVLGLPALYFSVDAEYARAASLTLVLGTYIGFDSQGHSHFAQNQHSGKITLVLLAMFTLSYGVTYL